VWKLDTILIDIDTAFLSGDLDQEIYMELPEGMTGFNGECLLLLKALYGLACAGSLTVAQEIYCHIEENWI